MEDALDILWIILCCGLVLVMQGGFLCLETGLTRSKNSINVALKNAMDLAFTIIVFWALGNAVMFGTSSGGVIGVDGFFGGGGMDPRSVSVFFFQALFCGTAVTIVSGAVAERLRFSMYIAVALVVAGFVYPLYGHWAWNGLGTDQLTGWLGQAGFVDWAGSTVVHSAGGWVALALLLIVGPRRGRFAEDGTPSQVTGSNLPLVALGVVLLWFGWIGFNGGSTLKLTTDIGIIVVNTSLAASAGALAATAWSLAFRGRVEYLPPLNGLLGGLVAVTASAHALSLASALIVGAIGGLVTAWLERWLIKARIDDAVGAVPVHLGAGIWGTLAVALFADPELLGTGLSRADQFLVQLKGVAACAGLAFLSAFPLFWVINKITPFRVSPEGEELGLNITEHGARTELFDFVSTLNRQAVTGDLSLRVPQDDFTEIGQIGGRYNEVMDVLEEAVAKSEAIVRTSNDAIIMFSRTVGVIVFVNPQARETFAPEGHALEGQDIGRLLPALAGADPALDTVFEAEGVRLDGSKFPVDLIIASAEFGDGELMIATIRDISSRKVAEAALQASEKRFRTVFQNSAIGMSVLDPTGRVMEVNPSFCDILDCTADRIMGTAFAGLVHAEDAAALRAGWRQVSQPGFQGAEEAWTSELRFHGVDSKALRWLRVSLTMAPDSLGQGRMVIALVEDTTELHASNQAMQLAASVFESTREGIVIFNPDGETHRVNRAFSELTGVHEREVRGFDLSYLLSSRYDGQFFEEVEKKLGEEGVWQGEVLLRKAGQEVMPSWLSLSLVRDKQGVPQNFIGIFSDLTERKDKEEAIWKHANVDLLTGLPNRRLFTHRLELALNQAKRRDTMVAAMFLDLDGFKGVNDTLGHNAGDELLKQVAERLKGCLRSTDMVARLGGDEFTIVLEDVERIEDAARIAGNIIRKVAEPYDLGAGEGEVSTSIGVAFYPEDALETEDLIKKADAALYHAKDMGKNTFKFFTSELDDQMKRRVSLEKDIRRAIKDDRIYVYYQPQVSLETGRVVSCEALVRMINGDGQLISPADFIPFAEESNLIIKVGRAVVRRVAADVLTWRDLGIDHLGVSVNISPRQFRGRVTFPDRFRNLLREMGVAEDRIAVEITEGGMMSDRQETVQQLQRLAARGVKISLDDFGKGFSSLSRLKHLPINELKIDMSFIRGIPGDAEDLAMVTAIIEMSRGLGIQVVAEGVEAPEQEDILRRLGCDRVQGYLYSKPLPHDDFVAFAKEYGAVCAAGPVKEAKAEPLANPISVPAPSNGAV